MKTTRRILALITVLALVLAMGTTAFAATITVDAVKKGEEYSVYKVLDYTAASTDEDAANEAFSYFLSKADYEAKITIGGVEKTRGEWLISVGFQFAASADGSQYVVTNSASLTGKGAELAEKITAIVPALIHVDTATATDDEDVSFTGLATGYYFVTSSMGSLCSLQTYDDEALVVEKNTVPTVDKTQSASANGTYAETALDVAIGDVVYYKAVVTDGAGTNEDIVLTDTMTDGLTLNAASITIKNGETPVAADNYTLTTTDHGFVLTLKASYVATLAENAVVTITYNATVNSAAVIDNASANGNFIKIEYSKQSMTDNTIYVITYDFLLKKTDGTKALAGAEFNLYTAETGGTPITFTKDTTGYYVSATGNAKIEAGDGTGVNIRGLEPGTYYLEDTVAPDGYNKLAARQPVVITAGATAAVEVEVENQAGTVLPSTGGMGTTIFYVLGGLMVLGALVVLVTNKRMRAN